MQLVNWILLFLATLFGYLDSMKATSLSQDTIRDEAYQLYPLGIACRNNDLETIKRLLAGKDEPMAIHHACLYNTFLRFCVDCSGSEGMGIIFICR